MSYILEALRRAETDRERECGQVPGLHTQPPSGSVAALATDRRRWLPWAGGSLLLLAGIGAGSWWANGQHGATALVPQPAPVPLATEVATAPPTTQPVVSMPMPQPAASGSSYLPLAPAPVVAAMPTRAPAAPPAPTPAPAAAVEEHIPRWSELPESTRRELPKLAISGSVYSDDPASRFLIANGEVLREGAKLGADLVLEQIRPHELVLRFKGQRYRQPV